MDARRLNRRVLIQRLVTGKDGIGQRGTQGWVPLITAGDGKVHANILSRNGSESIKAGAETSSAAVSIRIRYRTNVTAAMRVLHGTTTYEIKAVLPDEARREYVDLVCEVVQ